MKIEGFIREVKRAEFEVDFWTAFNAVQTEAYRLAGIPQVGTYAPYIDKGKIVTDVEQYAGAHSYFQTEVLSRTPRPSSLSC